MATRPSYRVLLSADWDLEDLYEFPHALSQCYSFVYCLDSELDIRDRDRIEYALRSYPWRGGYSYVNIYSVLRGQIPNRDRPKILSIQKTSPGWLDLLLNVNVAHQIAMSVTTLAGAGVAAVAAYKKCYSMILAINAERRKRRVENLQKSAAQVKALNALCTELAKQLGFKSLAQLHEYTSDPEVSLKMLMAHYRRMSVLLKYSKKEKATLTLPPPGSSGRGGAA